MNTPTENTPKREDLGKLLKGEKFGIFTSIENGESPGDFAWCLIGTGTPPANWQVFENQSNGTKWWPFDEAWQERIVYDWTDNGPIVRPEELNKP